MTTDPGTGPRRLDDLEQSAPTLEFAPTPPGPRPETRPLQQQSEPGWDAGAKDEDKGLLDDLLPDEAVLDEAHPDETLQGDSSEKDWARDDVASPEVDEAEHWIPERPTPAPPVRGVGYRLRQVAGVDEDVLDWVPGDRTRYASLGGVVLGTACMATVSMWFAISAVNGHHTWFAIPLALAWGLFICNLDRWLISGTSSRWQTRAASLLPRLVLALLFGTIIAEPFVLAVFHTAIEESIETDRLGDLDTLRNDLAACNPVPGVPIPTDQKPRPGLVCSTDLLLNIGSTAGEQLAELKALQDRRDAFSTALNADRAQLNTLNDTARRECNGTSGDGLTGDIGVGPNCRRNRGEADDFAEQSDLGSRQGELTRLNTRIETLASDLATDQDAFRAERTTKIDSRVQQEQNKQKDIGLLERVHALDDLSRQNAFVAATVWFVRVFFILIDCLPVIVKMFTPTTRYDRAAADRAATDEAIHQTQLEGLRARDEYVPKVEVYATQQRLLRAKRLVDGRARLAAARANAQVDVDIDELTTELLKPASTRRLDREIRLPR